MQIQDELYQLVKALSANEKRYFKLYAGRHSANSKTNYEKLFDVIAEWPDDKPYDDDLLMDALKRKKLGKFLSSDKVKLQSLITDSIRAYRSGSSVEQQITDLLADETFFKTKRLNRHRLKAIQKAKELAWKYELYPFLITILQREIVASIELQQEKLGRNHAAIEEETHKAFRFLHLNVDLRRMYERVFVQARAALNGSEAAMKLADEVLALPLIAEYQPGQSFTCDKLFYQTKGLCHRLLFQRREYADALLSIEKLFEQYSYFIEYDRVAYKVSLYNLMNALLKVEDFERFHSILDKAAGLSSKDMDEEGEDWQNNILLKLQSYIIEGRFSEGANLREEVNTGLQKYANKVNAARRIAIWSNLMNCMLLAGDVGGALEYNNLILQDKTEARKDIKLESRRLELFIHYLLGNYQIVESQIRNLTRSIKLERALKDQEEFYFDTLKKLIKIVGQRIPKDQIQEIMGRWQEVSGLENLNAVQILVEWLGKRVPKEMEEQS